MKLSLIIPAALASLFLVACDANDGPIERAAENVDEAIDGNDTVGENLEEAADDAADAIDEAADDTADAMDEAGERMEEATDPQN